MKTLAGLQIVITRPEAQGRRWQAQLQALGARTHLLPVLQIVPVNSGNEIQAISNLAAHLDQFQKIIFISQNAVGEAQKYFPSLPADCELFAIGSTTAATLRAWAGDVQAADKAMNSETLLTLDALQARQIKGQRILICRGVGGRATLGDTLRRRGAEVDYCELYHRQRQPRAESRLRQLLAASGERSGEFVLTTHSGDSLQYLQETMTQVGDTAATLHDWPLLVPGERVAANAKQLGFTEIICARNASDEIMTQTLVDWRAKRGQS